MNETAGDESATVKGAISVHALFSGKKQYEIPQFQRNYEWTTEQLEQFWSDVTSSNGRAVFLGPATWTVEKLSSDITKYRVIDGQQRLTTILLLLSLIRAFCVKELNDFSYMTTRPDGRVPVSLADELTKNIINAGDKDNIEDFFLNGNEKNQNFLRQWVFRSPKDNDWQPISNFSSDRQTRRHLARLINAAKFFNDKLNQIHKIEGQDLDATGKALHEIVKSIRKMEILPMVVNNEAEAYALFESLNDRGLSLMLSDLLKSHLLRRAAESSDVSLTEVGQRWASAENDAGSPMTTVLQYLLLGEPKYSSSKNFYDSFKLMASSESLEDVLSKIESFSQNYGLVQTPEEYSENNELSDLQKSFKALNLAGIKSVRILLLAVLNLSLSDEEQADLVRAIENYSFRWRLTKGHEQTYKDKMIEWALFANKAREDGMGDNTIAQKLIAKITKETITDKDFADGEGHQITSEPHSAVVRALLFRAEWCFRSGGTQVKYKEIQVEHIAPEGGKEDWYEALNISAEVEEESNSTTDQLAELRAERYSELVNAWGNKTLLLGSHNAQAKNRGWQDKCDGFPYKRKANSRKLTHFEGYKASDFKITEDLAKSGLQSWTQAEIEARTAWLFMVASNVWNVNWQQIKNEGRIKPFSVWLKTRGT